MKHFTFLLGSALLSVGTAQAQPGLRLGANTADLRTTSGSVFTTSTISRAGYQAGIYYQVPLCRRLTLVPEVQYSRERLSYAQVSYALTDGRIDSDYRLYLSYVNVPIMLRVTVGPVYLEAGPQVAVLLGGRQEGFTRSFSGWTGTLTYTDADGSVTDRFRRFDAGPGVGVGANLPAGFGLSLRAYRGLVSLTQNSEESAAGRAYRQTIQASVTYRLPGRS